MEDSVINWLLFAIFVVLAIVALTRSGWAQGVKDPVTFLALSGTCSSLIRALDQSLSSPAGAVLFTIEIVALMYALYLLWRRVHPSDPNAA